MNPVTPVLTGELDYNKYGIKDGIGLKLYIYVTFLFTGIGYQL